VVDRVWEAEQEQANVWGLEGEEEEEWVEEDWGRTVNVFAHSVGSGRLTKEGFPVLNRNAQNVEFQ